MIVLLFAFALSAAPPLDVAAEARTVGAELCAVRRVVRAARDGLASCLAPGACTPPEYEEWQAEYDSATQEERNMRLHEALRLSAIATQAEIADVWARVAKSASRCALTASPQGSAR